jgi:M6 family metalloprotease-like protein
MAHEYGHALGLPDLYDVAYDNPAQDSAGIGHWGLMGWGANDWDFSGGPVAFSAWSLEQLGWLGNNNERLVEITADTKDLLVEDVHAGGTVYRIPLGLPPVRIGQHQQEYLLLEQRTRTYYNQDSPAEGLLVWYRLDYSASRGRG